MEQESSILEELLKRKGRKASSNSIRSPRKSKSVSSSGRSRPRRLSTSNEVVVKVLNGGKFGGHGHSKQALKNCLHYVIKGTEDLKLQDQYGNEYTKSDVNTLIDKHSAGFVESPQDAKQKNRLFTHMAISLPNNMKDYSKFENYNDEALKKVLHEVTVSTLSKKYPLHDFFVAIQDNGNNLHAHIPIMCKGHDGKKLRIQPEDLQELRKEIANNFKDYDINLRATRVQERKPKLKQVHIENNFKVGEVFQKKTPSWFEKKDKLKNLTITASFTKYTKESKDNTNQIKEFDKLNKAFKKMFKDDKSSLNSFLLMYQENKSLAKWALETQPKVFGLIKNNKKFKEFNIDMKNINPKILVKANTLEKSY